MRIVLQVGISIFFCLLIFGTAAKAQTKPGKLTGIVQDAQGAMISNAKIIAINQSKEVSSLNRMASELSRADGTYTFINLLPGSYLVEVMASGFGAKIEKQIEIIAEQTTTLNFQFTPAQVCAKGNGKNIRLSDEDKADMTKQVISHYLTYQRTHLPLLLSTKNIKKEWLPQLPPTTLVALSGWGKFKQEFKKDFYYAYFSEFEVLGECVTLSITYTLNSGCNLCGSGDSYIFQKENGKWKMTYLGGWIS